VAQRQRAHPGRHHIVAGMTSTGFTVNDPLDPLGLDCVGFDAALPRVMSDFSSGRI
jgi:60 kDa SS-A/Ro ribonucleoprotein